MNDDLNDVQALRFAAEQKSLEGDLDIALQLLDKAEQVANVNGDPLDMALVWRGRANVYQHHDQFADSLNATQNAVAIYEKHGEPFDIAVARTIEVFVLGALERYEEAEALAEWIRPHFVAEKFVLGQAALAANLARVYTDSWQLPKALTQFRHAHDLYKRLGNHGRAAKVLSDMGIVAEQMDNFDLAQECYETAYPDLVAAGDILTVVKNQFNLAQLCLRQARYKQALIYLHQARTNAESYPDSTNADTFATAYINLYEAQVRRQLGEIDLTLHLLHTALTQFNDWDRHIEQVQVLIELSHTISIKPTSANLQQALAWLTEAENTLLTLSMPLFLALVRLQKGELLFALHQLTAAAECAQLALEPFQKHHLNLRQAQAQTLLADCLWQLRPEKAHHLYQQTLLIISDDVPELIIRCWHGLARLAKLDNNLTLAETAYTNAIQHVQIIQHNLSTHTHRAGFLADKQHLLEELLAVLHEQTGREQEIALRVEQFKASALAAMLWKHPVETLHTPQLQALLTERTQLRQELDAQQTLFTHLSATSQLPTRTAYVKYDHQQQTKIRQIRQKLQYVDEKIAHQQDSALNWQEGIPASSTNLHQLLDFETGLVSFYQVQERLFALTATHETGDLYVHKLDTDVQEIVQLWQKGRRWIVRPQTNISQAQNRLAVFWEKLIQPWYSHLASKKRLIILPHPDLYQLPFTAFYDDREQRYLLDVWQLQLAPSATILAMHQGKKENLKPPLIVGYAGKPNHSAYLPNVVEEIKQLANIWPQATIFQDEEALAENILTQMSHRSFVHIAGHTIYTGQSPLESGIPLANGKWLRATDLYLAYGQLSGSNIILSGCESGRGQTIGSDVLGLTSAFLYAGASSVIASLWRVDDEATMHMMVNLYSMLKQNLTLVASLQLAQQMVRSETNFAHPYFWSPFILNGHNH